MSVNLRSLFAPMSPSSTLTNLLRNNWKSVKLTLMSSWWILHGNSPARSLQEVLPSNMIVLMTNTSKKYQFQSFKKMVAFLLYGPSMQNMPSLYTWWKKSGDTNLWTQLHGSRRLSTERLPKVMDFTCNTQRKHA